jgi:hypothetical protein
MCGRHTTDRRWFYVVTVKDRRPLPLMDEQLDRLGTLGGNRAGREYKYVTALEMFRVFIMCRYTRTVFVTSGSHYEFLRFRTFDEQCTRTIEGYSSIPVCG